MLPQSVGSTHTYLDSGIEIATTETASCYMEQNLHVHVCVIAIYILNFVCLQIIFTIKQEYLQKMGRKNCKKCKHPAKGHMGHCGDKCANAPKSAPTTNSSSVNSTVSTGNLTSTPETHSGSVQKLNTTHTTSPGVT